VRNELDFGLVEGATILPDLVAEPYMDDELLIIRVFGNRVHVG